MSKNYKLRVIVISSLMAAIAVALRYFGTMIPLFGAQGMRISFAGVFSKIPAFLFGPLVGGLTSGVVDVIACLVKPEGPFNICYTITAILGGVICGFIWFKLKDKPTNIIRKTLYISSFLIGIIVVYGFINLTFFKGSPFSQYIFSFKSAKQTIIIYGVLLIFILLLLLCVSDLIISKKKSELANDFVKLLVSLFIANIIVTTLNTYFILIFTPSIKATFIIFYIPRLVEELVMTIIQCYAVSFLLDLMKKTRIL